MPSKRRICVSLAPDRRVRLGLGLLFTKAMLERTPVHDEPGGSCAAHAWVGAHLTEGFDQPTVNEDIDWSDSALACNAPDAPDLPHCLEDQRYREEHDKYALRLWSIPITEYGEFAQ